jgi:hypothetical protein
MMGRHGEGAGGTSYDRLIEAQISLSQRTTKTGRECTFPDQKGIFMLKSETIPADNRFWFYRSSRDPLTEEKFVLPLVLRCPQTW